MADQLPEEKFKICSCCKDSKPTANFTKDSKRKDKLSPYCKECHKAKRQASDYSKTYYQSNKAVCHDRLLSWQRENRDKTRAWCRKYYENNRQQEITRSIHKRQVRDGRSIQLTPQQEQDIRDFYWLSKDLSAVSGEAYHVDHIIPLQGKNVCGLHVPWNLQILPADINLSKGNSYANDA